MKAKTVALLIMLSILLLPPARAAPSKPLVVATIAPLAGIVKDAFGDSVKVVYVIPQGADPHEYQLTASQIELLRRADVIVTTGGHLPLERRIAELEKDGTIRGRALFVDDYEKDGFRYLKEHWYNDKDNPHGVWLDPDNALAIAKATEKALESVNPGDAELYASKYRDFEERVNAIVESYRAVVGPDETAVIQMPPDQYAVEWMGIEAVASIKPEEEVPALGTDKLVPTAEKVSVIVYGNDSPDQLKNAAIELAEKSGKPTGVITVFGSDEPYTKLLIRNSAAVIKAMHSEGKGEHQTKDNTTEYVVLSLVVGTVLGTAIGVVLKK